MSASKRPRYQVFGDLPPDQYAALRDDIARRGVQVAVEFDEAGQVIDGHQRLRAVSDLGLSEFPSVVKAGLSEGEKLEHAFRQNLLRRHLNDISWAQGFKRYAALRGVRLGSGKGDPTAKAESAAALAVELGVKPRTARYRLQVADALEAHPDLAAKVESGEMPSKRALNVARDRNARNRPAPHPEAMPSEIDIRHGDFRTLLAEVADDSVDLIFTDPPYGGRWVHLNGDLGAFAARVLKPGGFLLVYVGHLFLPEVMRVLGEHIDFYWCLALIQPGKHARIHVRRVSTGWRPVLAYRKPPKTGGPWLFDTFTVAQPPDKALHRWQQGLDPALHYVERLSEPGDLVVDPFVGAGTTAVAAYRLGRRFLGAEIDPQSWNVARVRIADEAKGAE
jgi:SAM-dependent methyltransferase